MSCERARKGVWIHYASQALPQAPSCALSGSDFANDPAVDDERRRRGAPPSQPQPAHGAGAPADPGAIGPFSLETQGRKTGSPSGAPRRPVSSALIGCARFSLTGEPHAQGCRLSPEHFHGVFPSALPGPQRSRRHPLDRLERTGEGTDMSSYPRNRVPGTRRWFFVFFS